MKHTLCTIIIISYYSSFFVSEWFYGHLNEVPDNEAMAVIALHYGYTWWSGVSQFFYYEPLRGGRWDLKPQLLASRWAPAGHVDLSIHLYLNNLHAFCLTEPQNHQKEKSPWWFHIHFVKEDPWKFQDIKDKESFVLFPGRTDWHVVAFTLMFTY